MKTQFFRFLFAKFALFVVVQSPAYGEWPQWRGPKADGHSPETGIHKDWTAKAPKTLWTVDLSDEGYANPSASGGKVFIIDHDKKQDIVRAIDLKTGNEAWRHTYDAGGRENYGWARATPTVENDRVYTVSRDGVVYCLDTENGEEIWTYDALNDVSGKAPGWEVSHSPLIEGNQLIVPGGGKEAHIVALDKISGKPLWKGGGTYKLGYATPVLTTLDSKKQLLVFNAFGLTGVDATDGKLLWSTKWKTMWDVNAPTPIPIGNDRVYISSGYRKGCAVYEIKNNTPEEICRNRTIPSKFNTGLFHEGHIYSTADSGYLICLKADTGETAWKHKAYRQGGLLA
ncbi:MAG: PQQ-binding-like beta-propeller repeat protein, partial [Verrucomicrobiota bacterium]